MPKRKLTNIPSQLIFILIARILHRQVRVCEKLERVCQLLLLLLRPPPPTLDSLERGKLSTAQLKNYLFRSGFFMLKEDAVLFLNGFAGESN